MALLLERAKFSEPRRGEWRGILREDGRPTAILRCPRCGQLRGLEAHDIDSGGEIDPPLRCAGPGCRLNTEVELVGWSAYVAEVDSEARGGDASDDQETPS